VTGRHQYESVHLTNFPVADESLIDKDLEERMIIAQHISSMVLSLRKKVNIRVRQPLGKIMVPALDVHLQKQIEAVKGLILSEVNVKELEFITDAAGILVKKIKPNFKTLGPKFGKLMKQIATVISEFSQDDINKIEQNGVYTLEAAGEKLEITLSDVEILSEDIPGWLVTNMGSLTVALDITLTEQLKEEGIARELINRIQNIRKDSNFEVTDKIVVKLEKQDKINLSIENNISYICTETLAVSLELVDKIDSADKIEIELVDDIIARMLISKV
jgi:isoleucyl-tRNA synthetase